MNFMTLKSIIGVETGALKNDKVTIAANSFTSNLTSFLEYCYDNQPIIIDSAQYVSEDVIGNMVTIRGQSDFLNVAGLDTEIRFSIDDQGQVQLFLKYALIASQPTPSPWKFSTSFPNLPQVVDLNEATYFDPFTQQISQTMVAPLDQLSLFDSYYVVVSQPQQEPDFNVALNWGINFVSHLQPQSFLGIIESLFAQTTELTISGTIRKPLPTETPKQLALQYADSIAQRRYPWDVAQEISNGLPGILLQVALNINYSIIDDKIVFKGEKLYLYTPLDNNWLLTNTIPNFVPIQAYTGSVELTGTGIKMDVVSPIQIGVDEFILISTFEGVSFSNLSQLIGLTGSSESLLNQMPAEIQKMGEVLGALSLINAEIDVDYFDIKDVNVSYISFTIGMPDLKWQVWEDHFEIDSIYCTFEIYYPLRSDSDPDMGRDVKVTVYGQLEIETVPFDVYASNQDEFTVYAEMAEKQTLPLKKILETFAPGVPPPPNSDLTINIFRVDIAPQVAYSMALAMAQEPEPWVIPIGHSSLTVGDVSIGFMYPKGGPVQGSVSGTIEFGDFAQLSIAYDIPGDIIIRTLLPDVHLTQLVGTLLGKVKDLGLKLPADFDINLTNSSMVMQEIGNNNWMLKLGTEVEKFGSLAFLVTLTNKEWGFAAGLDLVQGQASGLDGLSALAKFEEAFLLDKLVLIVSSIKNPPLDFLDLSVFHNPTLSSQKITLPINPGNEIGTGMELFAELTLNNQNHEQRAIKKVLHLPDSGLFIVLTIGENPEADSQLSIGVDTQINKHTSLSAHLIASIQGGEIGFSLQGTLKTMVEKQPMEFDLAIAVVEGGAFVSGSMEGNIKFGDIQLSNLAIEIGADWDGIPSMGIAATIDVENFESSMVVFFDSTYPSKSMLAGSISNISLRDIVKTFAGANVAIPAQVDEMLGDIGLEGSQNFTIPASANLADSLDKRQFSDVVAAFQKYGSITIPNKGGSASSTSLLIIVNQEGKVWHLTDISTMDHYELRNSGDSIQVALEPQFYIAPTDVTIGKLLFLTGYRISGSLQILSFKASASVDILPNSGISVDGSLSPIHITSKGTTLLRITGSGGKAGPELSISTFTKTPHIYISGDVKLLGVGDADVLVEVSKAGMYLNLKGELVEGSQFDIHANFSSLNDLGGGGMVTVKVNDVVDLPDLGKIGPSVTVASKLDFSFDGKDARASLEGDFDFEGKSYHILKFDLDIDKQSLADLDDIFREKVRTLLKDIFAEARKYLQDAKDEVKTITQQAEREVQKIQNAASQDVQKIAQDADAEVNRILSDATKEAQKISAEAQQIITEANRTLQQAYAEFQELETEVSKLTEEAEKETERVASSIAKGAVKVARDSLDGIHKVVTKVGDAVSHGIKDGAEKIKHFLKL